MQFLGHIIAIITRYGYDFFGFACPFNQVAWRVKKNIIPVHGDGIWHPGDLINEIRKFQVVIREMGMNVLDLVFFDNLKNSAKRKQVPKFIHVPLPASIDALPETEAGK